MAAVIEKSICLIIVYLGKFPPWFPAFLVSCACNPNIQWIVFTDAIHPKSKPKNVTFNSIDLSSFIEMATKTMGCEVNFTKSHKLCDFKPAYGAIFSDHLNKYNYWGHCDLDLVWGDIELFLNSVNFQEYDIISTRKLAICGHFTLYKNHNEINLLYKQVENYHKVFVKDEYSGFDEGFFSYHLYQKSLDENFQYKIYWPGKYAVDWPELEINPIGWYWSAGKIYGNKGKERIYLHFMKWKQSLQKIDFSYEQAPTKFRITKYGIWSKNMSLTGWLKYLSSIKLKVTILHFYHLSRNFINVTLLKKERKDKPNIPAGYEIIK